ncbi:MAG: class IV adenylate cyclase [Chloroflexota bacterium]
MQEIEAKFYVRDLKKIEARIQTLDARLIQPRVLETNIRFDLPDGGLSSKGQVLRLRQDTQAKFTYKDAGTKQQGIINRTEIEFVVESFDKAKSFLEALGYKKLIQYNKYRTTYSLESDSLLSENQKQASGLQSCHIMLDELPYGNFVEIEGEDIAAIHTIAQKLNLDIQAAITAGYTNLFENARRSMGFTFTDLTFANFEGLQVLPQHLQVQPAD